MPNLVTNVITFEGDEDRIKEMLEAIKNDNEGYGSIDFEKIVPSPKYLDLEGTKRADEALGMYKDFVAWYSHRKTSGDIDLMNIPEKYEKTYLKQNAAISQKTMDFGKLMFQTTHRYGVPMWYGWRITNWGTKWNAYDQSLEIGNNVISFFTAWSPPTPILEKLSGMYKDIKMTHEWADEDIGNNCGRIIYENGEEKESYIPEDQKEAYEFAWRMWGYDEEELVEREAELFNG